MSCFLPSLQNKIWHITLNLNQANQMCELWPKRMTAICLLGIVLKSEALKIQFALYMYCSQHTLK